MENFYEKEKNNLFVYNLKRFFTNIFNKSKMLEEKNSSSIMQKLRYFDETGEEFVLSTDDVVLELNNYDKEITSEKDLVLIYASNVAPFGNKILTPREINEKDEYELSLTNGMQYTVELSTNFHNSIHFCMNSYFSNETCRYAVCIPLNKFKGKIYGGTECDLFTIGSVNLDKNVYILCPEKEVKDIKKSNGKVKVIGFKGDNACSYINKFINLGLDFKYKEPGIDDKEWRKDNQDKEFIYKVFEKNKWYIGDYKNTVLIDDENRKESIEKIVKTILLIKERNLIEIEGEDTIRNLLIETFECGNVKNSYSFLIDYSLDKKFNTAFNYIVKKMTGVKFANIEKWKKKYSFFVQQDLKLLLCERTISSLED